jgi:uncharacterized RDD family membrane protein YckC
MPDAFVYCSRCGTQNPVAAQFCQKCGSATAPATFLKAVNQINAEEPAVELFGAIFLMIPLVWIVQWLYDALATGSSWQGTVGKKILRLKVTDEAGNRISFGRATGRFFGKLLSGMIMNVGFIMVAFTAR